VPVSNDGTCNRCHRRDWCAQPQPFTVRSKKLSQLLRLDRIVFMNIVQQYKEDGQRIVDNLLQVHHYSRCSPSLCFFFLVEERSSTVLLARYTIKALLRLVLQRLRESDDPQFEEVSSEIKLLLAKGSDISEPSLCVVVAGGNLELLQHLLSKGADVDKTDYCGRTALANALLFL
jgi:hypothetical protein